MDCSFLSAFAGGLGVVFVGEGVDGGDGVEGAAVVCEGVDDCDDSTVLVPAAEVTTFEDFGGLKYRPPGGFEEKKE